MGGRNLLLEFLSWPIGPVGMMYVAARRAPTQIAPPIVVVAYRYLYVANQGPTMIVKAGSDGKMYPTSLDGGREKKIGTTPNQTKPRERNDDADVCMTERQ
jgi:hypothetical protein